MYGLILFQLTAIALLGMFIARAVYSYCKDAKTLRRFPSVSVAASQTRGP